MDRPAKPDAFTLTLVPPANDDRGQAFRRLRALLKAAWRAYGLKCTKVIAGNETITSQGIDRSDGP